MIGSFHQGGSERQAVSLTRILQADGTFDVFAATLNKEGVLLDEIESLGLPEIREYKLTSFYNTNFIGQVRRLARDLATDKIDIIHTHDFYTNVFGMAAATLTSGSIKIASKRETGGMRSRGQEIVERIAFGRADAITVNAAAVRDHLTAGGVSAGKIRIIYNGLDLSRFGLDPPSLESLGLAGFENARLITLVANLRHNVKNVPMFLRAAKSVTERVTDARFIIAGEGEMEPELTALAGSLGVADRTHFTGRCTDIPGLLSASYACVLTSTAEGFSNSILEYMAAGKPVVATNVGGAAEAIVEGKTGYLVASDDDAAMAERLIELLDDGEKASRFGAAGGQVAIENFSIESRLAKTIKLYSTLIETRSR